MGLASLNIAWILLESSTRTDLEPWQSKRWQKEVHFGHCCAVCSVQTWSCYKIDMPSFSPTTSLTLLKMIRGNFNGNADNFGNGNSGIIGDGNIVSTQMSIHVTSDRDALTSSLPSMHPHRRPKDFISWDKGFLLERLMTRPNATRRQIVTLIPARPFDRLS